MSVPVPDGGARAAGVWVGFGVPCHPPPCVCVSPTVSNGPVEVTSLEGGPLAWKEGRQLLRQ